ncbi:MAG: DUF559 domain-containing protein [Gammaproteobacteria bacterium]
MTEQGEPLPPLRGKGGMGVAATPMPNENARKLRKSMTDAERALWRLLRERQVELEPSFRAG